jgi:hypothetical protein
MMAFFDSVYRANATQQLLFNATKAVHHTTNEAFYIDMPGAACRVQRRAHNRSPGTHQAIVGPGQASPTCLARTPLPPPRASSTSYSRLALASIDGPTAALL